MPAMDPFSYKTDECQESGMKEHGKSQSAYITSQTTWTQNLSNVEFRTSFSVLLMCPSWMQLYNKHLTIFRFVIKNSGCILQGLILSSAECHFSRGQVLWFPLKCILAALYCPEWGMYVWEGVHLLHLHCPLKKLWIHRSPLVCKL